MNTKTLVEKGYSVEALRKFKRQTLLRKLYRYAQILVLVCMVTFPLVNYFSKLPRERHAKNFSYLEKIKLGAKRSLRSTWLTMSALHEMPKASKLTKAELYIKGKHLDSLNSDLPSSGKDFKKAKLKIADKEYSVEARYKGDSINHWAFPQKSWRVEVAKGKTWEGVRTFNLNVPRVDTQLSNWLGYELARNLTSALVPEAELMHFRLNRLYDGVRLFLEQPDQSFLIRRNLQPGKIFVGDITSEEIYGSLKRDRIYVDSDAWEVRSPTEDAGTREMSALVNIIKNEHNPYNFYNRISKVLNTKATLEYMAMLELVGSVHVDETHNGKLYFDPVVGKLIPIVWDTVAYMWGNTKQLDMATNSLFRVMLSNPGLREEKDRFLWNFITSDASVEKIQELVINKSNDIRTDVYSFPLKIHANDKGVRNISNEDWENSIKKLLRTIEERNNLIKNYLSDSKLSFKLQKKSSKKYLLGLNVPSAVGVTLESIELQLASKRAGQVMTIKRRGLSDVASTVDGYTLKSVSDQSGKVIFKLSDSLYSKRRFQKRSRDVVASTYVYEVDSSSSSVVAVSEIKAFNSVTKAVVEPSSNPSLQISDVHKANSLWWNPDSFSNNEKSTLSGRVEVTENLVFKSGLKVLAGTELIVSPDVSIVVEGGSLSMIGSKSEPIVVRGLDVQNPWGVFAIKDADFEISNTVFEGGSESVISFVRYGEPLSILNSNGTVSESQFKDARVFVRNSEVKFSLIDFEGVFSSLFDVQNAGIQTDKITRKGRQAIHNASQILPSKAYGTPKRIEREFKFSLSGEGLKDHSLNWVSEQVHKALNRKVKGSDVWKAPKLVNQNYYTDKSVKDFMFSDIYFDTSDSINYKHSISYRLRNRFSSYKSYKYHIKNPRWTDHWPYRLEYQSKFNRKEVGNGFSTVEESRFEFRKESLPFSETKLPPPPPWNYDDFIPYFEAGNYKGLVTLPAQDLLVYLKDFYPGREKYDFKPKVVLLTERFRQHFNIKTPWGSGPNPEQAYIISLDSSEVYPANEYLDYLNAKKLGSKDVDTPAKLGRILEVEVEFERNISDKLDQEIENAKKASNTDEVQKLSKVRDAFIADQATIMETVKEHFLSKKIDVRPASKSKFVQASEF